ncbi:MAG TPA: glycoside hydrolase family 9 protein, partial [Terriglobales bacterium]|nr:glycoside hydrolase family 9 protein [Terriglobales bacterium]
SAVYGRELKILTNHVGYEAEGPKSAVVLGQASDTVSHCAVRDDGTNRQVFSSIAHNTGPVNKWRNWNFWTLEFDPVNKEGKYHLECESNAGTIHSYAFAIQRDVLERTTLSNVIYYFKGQRSSGAMDQADRHLLFEGSKPGTLDAHGGWWDATGDYGKHLSHLSFSTYFNPQQIPLVVYSLLKSYDQLRHRGQPYAIRYEDRLLDEAMFGADYLMRLKVPGGSFYRSISSEEVHQRPEGRKVAGEMKAFGIFTSPEKRSGIVENAKNDLEYEVSYRSGGGVAIAALAMASTSPAAGEFQSADYLKAAEEAFDYLEKNNLRLINDAKENIVDDYCALAAATELFRATHNARYKAAADRRARSLTARLTSSGSHQNYWRADDGTRPFFHASDAGFPAVSLLYYAEIADEGIRSEVLQAVRKSLGSQLAMNQEVNNPFDYARQLVQGKSGARRTSFFFPHNSDAAPWWQGENARLASLATAAILASEQFPEDAGFRRQLLGFATDQLNWILGLNPFDSCMLYGVGHNNPRYMFFDSWEFTNAPGGISNGITSGFKDEDGIDYELTWRQTGADNDWRWTEQWLPHAAWYLLAVSALGGAAK